MTLRTEILELLKSKGPGSHPHEGIPGHRGGSKPRSYGEEKAQFSLGNGKTLHINKGDLTHIGTDAIVNAANEHLWHGAGLAGAIVRRGGQKIQDESDAWVQANGLASHDNPAVTGAGRLPTKHVIHAVAPVWNGGQNDEPHKLFNAYTTALDKATEMGLTSIALPSLGTGIFGVPKDVGANAAITAVRQHAARHPLSTLKDIYITNFDDPTVDTMKRTAEQHFGQPVAKSLMDFMLLLDEHAHKKKKVRKMGLRDEVQKAVGNRGNTTNHPTGPRQHTRADTRKILEEVEGVAGGSGSLIDPKRLHEHLAQHFQELGHPVMVADQLAEDVTETGAVDSHGRGDYEDGIYIPDKNHAAMEEELHNAILKAHEDQKILSSSQFGHDGPEKDYKPGNFQHNFTKSAWRELES